MAERADNQTPTRSGSLFSDARAFVSDPDFVLHVGDVRDTLKRLPDESVDCAMTSPPFYALRDYGVDGQIGLEATPEEWADQLVAVFAEVRRILRPSGTLWIECGDSYNSATSTSRAASTLEGSHGYWANPLIKHRINVAGVKAKDLLGTPWMLAFALRADGWYLRQSIIWHKPNAMPESATDRCTTNHSYVFLLSKQARYHFDSDAIAEPTSSEWNHDFRAGSTRYIGQPAAPSNHLVNPGNRRTNGQKARTDERRGFDNRLERADGLKNPRSVWTVPTQGYPEAHFATWPEALCERIIKAGCPEGGTVLDPFMGAGTTALVARRLGRKSVGVELNPEYARLCAARLGQQSLLAEGAA